jgi:beta-galactosidase beta subunit
MSSVEKKYKVHRRFNLDFEIVVQGRNEEEAAYSAESIELESWDEVDSSWELIDVSRVSHLVLVEDKEERQTTKPVIKIWERT